MAAASFVQTDFRFGKWSAQQQGRMDLKEFKAALNISTNYYPVEQGALMRRQGTRTCGYTHKGLPALLMDFEFTITQPYTAEFTDGIVRFWQGPVLVTDSTLAVLSISSDTPAVFTLAATLPNNWLSGDTVTFDINGTPCITLPLCNRQFNIIPFGSNGNQVTLVDALTGELLDGAGFTFSGLQNDPTINMQHAFYLDTPYTDGSWSLLRKVQDETDLILLHPSIIPYVLTVGGNQFALAPAVFVDGPYLDPNTTTTILSPSATSGSVTVLAGSVAGINDNQGFLATDVGRAIRMFSQPLAWSSVTTYAIGDTVTATDGNTYASLSAGNVDHNPLTDVTNWILTASGVVWTWLSITAVTDTTHVVATIEGPDFLNTVGNTGWQLGAWSDTTGWPTCGDLLEDRLVLTGQGANRVDLSMSGQHFTFSPTGPDGTVADDNAIAAVAAAKDLNQFVWASAGSEGITFGSLAGEWLMRASTLDDPITPTSIQFRRGTTYGCANVEAVRANRMLLFVQRYQRKVFEYGQFTTYGTFSAVSGAQGQNLAAEAEDLTINGIEQIVWQTDQNPTIWMRDGAGNLLGMVYQRAPEDVYHGWFQVEFGTGRVVSSIAVSPSTNGLAQDVYCVTNTILGGPGGVDDPYRVEVLTPMFDDSLSPPEAWFVDGGQSPCCATYNSGAQTVTLYGLWDFNGQTVSVVVGGLDLGDFAVSGGSVTVPINATNNPFTQDFLAEVTSDSYPFSAQFDFGLAGTDPTTPPVSVPSLIAYVNTNAGDVQGDSVDIAHPDWVNDQVVVASRSGNGTTSGLLAFDASTVGTIDLEASSDTIFSSDGIHSITNALCTGLGFDHKVYFQSNNPLTTIPIAQVPTNTLVAQQAEFVSFATTSLGYGVDLESLFPLEFTIPPQVGSLEPVNGKLTAMIGAGPDTNSKGYVAVFQTSGENMAAPAALHFSLDEKWPSVTPGLSRENVTTAYITGKASGNGSTTPIGVYQCVISVNALGTGLSAEYTKLGTFTAADIDATWTTYSAVTGLAYDQTDGCLISQAETTDSVTTKYRLFKFNPVTQAIIWSVALPGATAITAYADQNFGQARIQNQTFFLYIAGVIQAFNTVDGSVSLAHTVAGLVLSGGQISDDVTNSVTMNAAYTLTSPQPVLLGTWLNGGGGPDFTDQWCRVYAGAIPGQDRQHTRTVYSVPVPVGYTYTSQWQLLRPDYLQERQIGTQNGPGFGKKRRLHWASVNLYRTSGMSLGTTFNKLYPLALKTQAGVTISPPDYFSGVLAQPIENDYSYDGQICGQQTRPYPGIVTAVGGYGEGQDR